MIIHPTVHATHSNDTDAGVCVVKYKPPAETEWWSQSAAAQASWYVSRFQALGGIRPNSGFQRV